MNTVTASVRTVLLLIVTGCSGTSITNVTPGSGGTSALAGSSSIAGSTNQSSAGGLASNAGTTGSGGATVSIGGGLSLGGSDSSGGTGGASGGTNSAALGGFSVTGGTSATTGMTNVLTGGSNTIGGTSTTSGGANTGGVSVVTGGTTAGAGGTSMTGGANTGGVSLVTGGTSATSGGTAPATGGTAAATGGTSTTSGGANTGGVSLATGGTSATSGGTAPATGGTSAVTTGLLANCSLLLHMDETSWNSTPGEVRDASGAGNHGTAMIDANTATTAKFGRAGLFGGEGYVSVTSGDSLHAMGAFSVAAWIYPTFLDGTTRAPGIVAKRWAWNDSSEFAMYLGDENRLWVDVMTEDNRFASNTVFNMAVWYHVAVVFDGSLAADKRVSVYVNGQLDITAAESSSVVMPYDSPLEVGRLRDGGQGFIGSIDEVALWQRALSAAEVLSIYERTAAL